MNAANIETGKKFLEENKKRPEVVTLPSGLQYEVINEGNVGTYAKPPIRYNVTTKVH